MTGITGYGIYVPYLRISRGVIAAAWERNALKGTRSVSNNDEDVVTMGTEAVQNLLRGLKTEPDRLLFATTTSPYAEKSAAELIGSACDLKQSTQMADLGGSLRSGVAALELALESAVAGKASVVAAADCRAGYPGSEQEQLFGDAAAAVAVGSEHVIAAVECTATACNDLVDIWRLAGDTFVNVTEGRLASEEGYQKSMAAAINALLQKGGYQVSDFAKAIFTAGDLREAATLAKSFRFAPETVQDTFVAELGACGSAQPLFLLAAALETAKPGDLLLLAAYGNGATAMAFRVTPELEQFRPFRSISHYLRFNKELKSYSKFLSYRELIDTQKGEPFRLFPSTASYHRNHESIARFHGSRCADCGQPAFPVRRICPNCGAKDTQQIVPCAGKTAKLFTYTIDYLAGRPDDPIVVQAVLESDDGIRFYQNMTDYAPDEIAIGLETEFTFRKIYVGAEFINYYWKCRPVRKEAGQNGNG